MGRPPRKPPPSRRRPAANTGARRCSRQAASLATHSRHSHASNRNRGRSIRAKGAVMVTINLFLVPPLAALIGGILILLMPRLLNYIVAIYLIIVGIAGLWPHLGH